MAGSSWNVGRSLSALEVIYILICFPSVMVSCEFAILERRDLGLTHILFCQVSKSEKISHEETKHVCKRMSIMMDHRTSGQVRKVVGEESNETMKYVK